MGHTFCRTLHTNIQGALKHLATHDAAQQDSHWKVRAAVLSLEHRMFIAAGRLGKLAQCPRTVNPHFLHPTRGVQARAACVRAGALTSAFPLS